MNCYGVNQYSLLSEFDAKQAYERSLNALPRYSDGSPRDTWSKLPDRIKRSWRIRDPKQSTKIGYVEGAKGWRS